jgi:hypothetical protein
MQVKTIYSQIEFNPFGLYSLLLALLTYSSP